MPHLKKNIFIYQIKYTCLVLMNQLIIHDKNVKKLSFYIHLDLENFLNGLQT